MSNRTKRTWERVLKLIHDLMTDSSTGTERSAATREELHGLPETASQLLPRAVWKYLIKDKKVPKRLCMLLNKAWAQQHYLAAAATMKSLEVFLQQAQAALQRDVCLLGSSTDSLTTHCYKQLEEAGLPTALCRQLNTITLRLTKHLQHPPTAAAAAGQPADSGQQVCAIPPEGYIASTLCMGTRLVLGWLAEQVVQGECPGLLATLVLATAAAGRYCGARLQQPEVRAAADVHEDLHWLVMAVNRAAENVAFYVHDFAAEWLQGEQKEPDMQVASLWPSYSYCLHLMVAKHACVALRPNSMQSSSNTAPPGHQQPPQAPPQQQQHGGGQHPAADGQAEQPSALTDWQQVQALPEAWAPAAVSQLAAQLGWSDSAVLWLARETPGAVAAVRVTMQGMGHLLVMMHTMQACAEGRPAHASPEQLAARAMLHWLAAEVGGQNIPPAEYDGMFECVHSVLRYCQYQLAYWAGAAPARLALCCELQQQPPPGQQQQERSGQQQQQQQQHGQVPSGEASSPQLGADSSWELRVVAPGVADGLCCLSTILDKLQQQHKHLVAGGGSSSGSSSGGSSGGSSGADSPELLADRQLQAAMAAEATVGVVTAALLCAAQLRCSSKVQKRAAAEAKAAAPAAAVHTSWPARRAGTPVPACMRVHRQLCALLERHIRWAAVCSEHMQLVALDTLASIAEEGIGPPGTKQVIVRGGVLGNTVQVMQRRVGQTAAQCSALFGLLCSLLKLSRQQYAPFARGARKAVALAALAVLLSTMARLGAAAAAAAARKAAPGSDSSGCAPMAATNAAAAAAQVAVEGPSTQLHSGKQQQQQQDKEDKHEQQQQRQEEEDKHEQQQQRQQQLREDKDKQLQQQQQQEEEQPQQQHATQVVNRADAALRAGSSSSSSSSSMIAKLSAGAAAAGDVQLLPWLALIARALLLWGEDLQQQAVEIAVGCAANGIVKVLFGMVTHVSFICSKPVLQDTFVQEQLRAAGVEPTALQQQLVRTRSVLAATMGALKDSSTAIDAVVSSVTEAAEQLQAFGDMLAAVPISCACNNPWCNASTGPSEQQLVGGRSCICAGCRTARYCSRACQKQHWRLHRPVCKTLSAAQ